jgi:hypothetical protein
MSKVESVEKVYAKDVQPRTVESVRLLQAVLVLRPKDKAVQALVKTAINKIEKADSFLWNGVFAPETPAS